MVLVVNWPRHEETQVDKECLQTVCVVSRRRWSLLSFAAWPRRSPLCSIWQVRSGYFQTWKKYGNLWKALEISEKVWNFLPFTWEKNFEDRKCASIPHERSEAVVSNFTESSSDRVSFRPFTFVPIYRTNCTRRFQATTTKNSRSEQFVCREKFVCKPGHGSWLRLRVFANEESSPEPAVLSHHSSEFSFMFIGWCVR